MGELTVQARASGLCADDLFARLRDFSGYSSIAPSVRSVEICEDADGCQVSKWDVDFRGGVLCWSERDRFDLERRTITFSLVEGDMVGFEGSWSVDDRDGGVAVEFRASFDLGIASLAPIIEPVAAEALRANILELITACVQACPGATLVDSDATILTAPVT